MVLLMPGKELTDEDREATLAFIAKCRRLGKNMTADRFERVLAKVDAS